MLSGHVCDLTLQLFRLFLNFDVHLFRKRCRLRQRSFPLDPVNPESGDRTDSRLFASGGVNLVVQLHVASLSQYERSRTIGGDAYRDFDDLRFVGRTGDLKGLVQRKVFFLFGLHPAAERDEVPFLWRAFYSTDAKAKHVLTWSYPFDFVLGLQPSRRLIGRQRNDLFGVHVEDRKISASLRERIFEVSHESRTVLFKHLHAEFRLLFIGNALLRLARCKELFRRFITPLEIPVVCTADHRIRVQFNFASLLDRHRSMCR